MNLSGVSAARVFARDQKAAAGFEFGVITGLDPVIDVLLSFLRDEDVDGRVV
jgi:hypothetical protein